MVVDAGRRAQTVVDARKQAGLAAAGEVQEVQRPGPDAGGVGAPQHPADARATHVGHAHVDRAVHRRGAGDHHRRAPGRTASVDPQGELAVLDVDQVGQPVPVQVPQQQPTRVGAPRQPQCAAHLHPRPPAAPAQARPVADRAALNQHEVLQPIPGEVGEPDPRVGEGDVWETVQRGPRDHRSVVPALVGVVEEAR